ncbi:MAG: site-2 protease family protein [Cytophagaceae bacterium]|jgi:membrane-associated protease RseP (regulator of RpoE activity)|nr:site-2 protease family protein [Cytophagaceae bacterium]
MQSHDLKTYLKHLVLFLLTFISVTFAGAELQDASLEGWAYFRQGFTFSIPFLMFLTVHEFGHYFMAKKYNVSTSLPYYIPMPFLGMVGTLGAIITMKSQAATTRGIFDIGIAGPLAGFVVGVVCMIWGFLTLPPREDVYRIHPDYRMLDSLYQRYENKALDYNYLVSRDSLQYQRVQELIKADTTKSEIPKWYSFTGIGNSSAYERPEKFTIIGMGSNLLFLLAEKLLADPARVPPSYEIIHNPLLMAAFWALFFTGLNLFPIGQLDGGHVIYGLFGFKRHFQISRVVFLIFVFVAGIGIFRHNVFDINVFHAGIMDTFLIVGGYFFLLYQIFGRIFKQQRNVLLACTVIMFLQFMVEFLVPQWHGFPGWMLFAVILGRFVGLVHPPAMIEQPLDTKRKILGWLSLLILVLCFTPEPIKLIEIQP